MRRESKTGYGPRNVRVWKLEKKQRDAKEKAEKGKHKKDVSGAGKKMWTVGTMLLVAMLSVACGKKEAGEAAQSTGRAVVPAGWKTHDDARFSVAVPAGWNARSEAQTGRVEVSGPAGEMLVIWPVFLEGAGLQPSGATAVVIRMTATIWPDVMWRSAMPVGNNAVKLGGVRGESPVVSAFTWVSSARGTAGSFYAATAPGNQYAAATGTFASILGSFRGKGTGTGAGMAQAAQQGASLQYVQWMDPRENAFVVEVPAGWGVQGGLFRRAPTDAVASVVVDSPDGQVEVQMGDPNIPWFSEPTQMGMSMGFVEGRWYEPMPGSRMLIKRYLPAAYFLNEYVRTKAGSACQQLQMEQPRNRPDAVQSINALTAQAFGGGATMTQCTGGDVGFSCQRNGQPYRGYFFAITRLTRNMGVEGGTWDLYMLIGYMAAAARAEEGSEVASRVIGKMQYNPQWVAMQRGVTANASQIIAQTNAEISNMINAGYERRSAAEDNIARLRTNAIQGRLDVVDSNTGESLKVATGSDYYWMDYRGNIVGTGTASAPGVEFHELLQAP